MSTVHEVSVAMCAGATVSWVAAGGNVVGVFAIADAPRAEAAEAVSALRGAHLKAGTSDQL